VNRSLIVIVLAFLAVGLYSQTPRTVEENTRAGFERAQRVMIGDQEAINAEAFKPKTEVYQKKSETVVQPVYYRFNQNLLRATNRILLNKWLKESK
jgi:hypothetical protein